MGWLRKKAKQIGRGIKKIGKKIGKAFKKVLKPFAKIFNKLGPIGTIAMGMFLPGIGTALAGWGAGMGNIVGTMIKFVGNAIHYVSTAPSKIFGTITDALGASWNTLTGATSGTWQPGSWFDNFSTQMQERVAGDGWFGGKSGSWASFDTTGNILPSGVDFTEGGVTFDEATNTWMEAGPKGTMGKPLSKANIDFMNAKAAPVTPTLVSDGTVDRIGSDVGEGTYVDSVTRKPLKLDSSGTPIPLKAGTGAESFTQKVSSTEIPFTGKTAGEVGSNISTLATAQGAYNDFAGKGDDSRPFTTGIDYSLIGSTDQGSLYNTAAPWQPSYAFNPTEAQNGFNGHHGLPQGFDPLQMNGYGGMNFNAWHDYNMLMNADQRQLLNTQFG